MNNLTATRADGSVTVHFGGCADDRPNCLPIMDGWELPGPPLPARPEILNGTGTFPAIAAPA